MWYYIREKEKVGPLSDVAIASLFSEGKISESTYVWAPQMPKWVRLKDASIYRSITKAPENTSLKDFKFYTYLLRAMLFVWILFLGIKSYYLFEALAFFRNIWEGNYAITNIQAKLELSTIQSMLTFLNLFTCFVLILSIAATMRWMYSAAELSSLCDSEFKYTPRAAAFSFIIPIFNLVLPCRIVWNTLKSSLKALGKRFSAFDIAVFFSWCICWVLTVILFTTEKFTRTNGLENIQVSIYFSIYLLAMMAVTSILWLVLVTKISNLSRKFYSQT